MTEIWLPVKGWEGIYEVSSFGRVRSLDHYVNGKGGIPRLARGRILKPQIASGYLQVYFYENGKQKWYKVHRLVADAFLPVPPYLLMLLEKGDIGRLEINHKNENKLDCRVENIEWCSSMYNHRWGTHRQRISETKRKKFDTKLVKLGLTREEYKRWRAREYYHKRKKLSA